MGKTKHPARRHKPPSVVATFLFFLLIGGAIGVGAIVTYSVLQAFRPLQANFSYNSAVRESHRAAAYQRIPSGSRVSPSGCEAPALASLTDNLQQLRTAALNPLEAFYPLIKAEIITALLPPSYPYIHEGARGTYVPILMYHDITPVKEVDYDVTPQELAEHFATLKAAGMNPITMDQLLRHLETGASLPPKPILLTFDDNYRGQYLYAFPLLKQYNFPAVWSVHTGFVGSTQGKPKATWAELQEMAQSGLITIASHTVSHRNLTELSPAEIDRELVESKKILESKLGRPIKYFTYPEGSYTPAIKEQVAQAGYRAALSMSLDPNYETSATESEDVFSLRRYGQSRFSDVVKEAQQPLGETREPPLGETREPRWAETNFAAVVPVKQGFAPVNFHSSIEKHQVRVDGIRLTLVFGGQPVTAHADSRYQVEEIQKTIPNAVAAVDGGFFSLELLDSNQMIGPVLSRYSQTAGVFNPGKKGENPLLRGRPLVLISDRTVKFVPYDPDRHISLAAVEQELPGVKDAFVAAGWLVKNGKPRDAASFGKLYGFDAERDRAFWGIDRAGRPMIGVTMDMVDSVRLGQILAKVGIYEAVMLDSGASAALSYEGKSVMEYQPRPVPHVVALLPPQPVPASEKKDNTDWCQVSY